MTQRSLGISARWILAAGLLGAAIWLIGIATESGELTGMLVNGFFGGAALIFGSVLLVPQLAEVAGFPIRRFLGKIFWPDVSEETLANYDQARQFRQQWRYSEAIEAYFRIVKYHSQEAEAYREGIETAFEAKTPQIAEKFCRMGVRRLRAKADREEVQRSLDILIERAEALELAQKERVIDPLSRFDG